MVSNVAGQISATRQPLVMNNWGEPHTILVYGSTCIDQPTGRSTNRPTDRVRPSHVILIGCTCQRCHADVRGEQWQEPSTMGRRKAGETPAQRSARLERERDRRRQRRARETEAERETSVFLVGVAILFHVRLAAHSTQTVFTLSI